MRLLNALALFLLPLLQLGPAPSNQNPQTRAEALLDRARSVSDIRDPGSPPFRLTAAFSFIADDLDTVPGTYTETWLSETQWRREIAVHNVHHIDIRVGDKHWATKDDPALPERVLRVAKIFDMFPSRVQKLEFDSITERSSIRCAFTKSDAPQIRRALCFDKDTGTLIGTVEPSFLGTRFGDYSCQYQQFQKFGDRWFPRKTECLLERHREIEAQVTELVSSASVDAALFTRPPDSFEVGVCSGHSEPPRAVYMPNPDFPSSEPRQQSSVTLALMVDVKGHPQDVTVVNSGGKPFDEQAIRSVRKWQFKPATCNGEPFITRITVEVRFQVFH